MSLPPCEYFEYGCDQLTLGSRWETWLERFRLWLTMNGIKDEDRIRASFLTYMGIEAYAIFKSKRKDDDSEKSDECMKLMTEFFVSKRSTFTETQLLRDMTKRRDENMEMFPLRLRSAAKHCGFGSNLE